MPPPFVLSIVILVLMVVNLIGQVRLALQLRENRRVQMLLYANVDELMRQSAPRVINVDNRWQRPK